MEKNIFSVKEICDLFEVPKKVIYREIKKGKLHSCKVGGKFKFTLKALEDHFGKEKLDYFIEVYKEKIIFQNELREAFKKLRIYIMGTESVVKLSEVIDRANRYKDPNWTVEGFKDIEKNKDIYDFYNYKSLMEYDADIRDDKIRIFIEGGIFKPIMKIKLKKIESIL